jgi:acyl-CoA reductase-like NAD-dependent aldehyde dehydrogenase
MTLPFSVEADRCRQAQRAWARRPLRERLQCIRKLRHRLVDSAQQLALTVTQDVARPAAEVLVTDILPTADACRFLERQAQRLLRPRRVPLSQRPLWLFGSRDTVYRRPLGVVGIIGTWNYPILLNAVQIAQALAAGNGVLWKPSEFTPTLATALHRLFVEAGFPDDLFVQLPATREAGPALAEAAVDHVVFTGSAAVGRQLARRLGERLVPCTLELSGCDAMVVAADAPLSLAARAAWWGTTLNRGQTCLAVRRIFVERSAYPMFIEQLRALAGASRHQPLLTQAQAEQAERLVCEALQQGAQLLLAGGAPRAESEPPRYPPTFVIDARPEMSICREAAFAPIAAVLPFERLADVVDMNEHCPYALGVSLFMRDRGKAHALAEALGTGLVTCNDLIAPTAHPATPFGGRGASGWGPTQGAEGLLAMTAPQVISERSGAFRPHYATASGDQAVIGEMLRGMLIWRHAGRWRLRWAGFWKMVRAAWRFDVRRLG